MSSFICNLAQHYVSVYLRACARLLFRGACEASAEGEQEGKHVEQQSGALTDRGEEKFLQRVVKRSEWLAGVCLR